MKWLPRCGGGESGKEYTSVMTPESLYLSWPEGGGEAAVTGPDREVVALRRRALNPWCLAGSKGG